MASHFNRPSFADDPKLRCSKGFVRFGIYDNGPTRCAGWYCDGDGFTDGGFVSIDVRSPIGVAMPLLCEMMMNRCRVPVVIAAGVLWNRMHVERQRMRLQGADRRRNHDGNARTHVPSVWEGWPAVNGRSPAAQ